MTHVEHVNAVIHIVHLLPDHPDRVMADLGKKCSPAHSRYSQVSTSVPLVRPKSYISSAPFRRVVIVHIAGAALVDRKTRLSVVLPIDVIVNPVELYLAPAPMQIIALESCAIGGSPPAISVVPPKFSLTSSNMRRTSRAKCPWTQLLTLRSVLTRLTTVE